MDLKKFVYVKLDVWEKHIAWTWVNHPKIFDNKALAWKLISRNSEFILHGPFENPVTVLICNVFFAMQCKIDLNYRIVFQGENRWWRQYFTEWLSFSVFKESTYVKFSKKSINAYSLSKFLQTQTHIHYLYFLVHAVMKICSSVDIVRKKFSCQTWIFELRQSRFMTDVSWQDFTNL